MCAKWCATVPHMATTEAVPNRITDELKARGLTATTVMAMINMTPTTWYRRMRHPDGWTLGELDALADVLRIERGRLTG